jgi:hypothetical protein
MVPTTFIALAALAVNIQWSNALPPLDNAVTIVEEELSFAVFNVTLNVR